MYAIPLAALVLLAVIAVAWSPIFAVGAFVVFFVLFLVYSGLKPRADEQIDPPTGSANKYEDDTHTGAWGERRG